MRIILVFPKFVLTVYTIYRNISSKEQAMLALCVIDICCAGQLLEFHISQ